MTTSAGGGVKIMDFDNEIEVEKFEESIGLVAGIGFLMYRSAVDAGASTGEAFGIVNAFFSAFLDSKVTGEKDKDQAEEP